MVVGFAFVLVSFLFLYAGVKGQSLGEVIRGELAGPGRGLLSLADIRIPDLGARASGATDATGATFASVGGSGRAGVIEVFYDPLGYYLDNGKVVDGAIGGHGDHVHVSAPTARLRELAEIGRKQFKLTIREFAPYDPVDPVHTATSFHYRNMAFDASGTAANMLAFARYLIGPR